MTARDSIHVKVCRVKKELKPTSPVITKTILKSQNDVVLFENINGKKAVANLFSTRDKVAKYLGISEKDILPFLSKAVEKPIKPKLVSNPDFKECSVPLDLKKLPITKYYPGDGGRYVTSAIVVSEFGGKKNISFHRLMLIGKDEFAIRLVPRHLHKMYEESKKKGKELPISICIGAPPQVMISAATPVPYDTDEMDVAASFTKISTGRNLSVGKCDNGLVVPSECDYVMEGKITLDETNEGPFVDITGTYDYVRKQPIVKIEKIWSCKNPVFQLLVPGGLEHYLFMGVPREPMIFKAIKKAGVEPVNVRLTEGGCCWLDGVVSIRKKKKNDGIKAINAAFEGHPSMKNVIVVDSDIDIFDDKEVEWAVATRFQADRIVILKNQKGSSLDPSADKSITNKVGIDATIPHGKKKESFKKALL